MAGTYAALREMLKYDARIAVSGRLVLANNKDGKLVLQRRGVHEIVESRKVPTFLMDATLPEAEILRVFFPQLRDEDITRIDVDMPEHVHVTQVLGTKTADLKLWGRGDTAKGENREDVKRFILQWWLEDDRRSMLVVCQEKYEKWLRANLPKEILVPPKSKRELKWDDRVIAIEHYNNVSGLDIYRNVSSILLIGRIQPSPESVQNYAGALLGTEPSVMFKPRQPDGTPGEWFKPPVRRAIRMADGSGRVVEGCDCHPDPMCEAVRLLQCEGEVIQAFGRARAVNRTAANPLGAGILNDVVCDLTVNRILRWSAPIELFEPLTLDGLVPTAPGDLAKGWPGIWENARAAKYTLKKLGAAARRGAKGFQDNFSSIYLLLEKLSRNTPDTASLSSARAGASTEDIPSSIAVAQYQVGRGRGQRFREVIFDLRVLSHPGAKLIEKLGKAYHAFAHKLFRRDLQLLAGAGGVEIVDRLVRILRKARYVLAADVKQHKAYTGVGRAGRFTLSKDPKALAAHDGSPGGITTPHLDAYSELPIELRMLALGLHDTSRNGPQ
jgi:hypothetical protein